MKDSLRRLGRRRRQEIGGVSMITLITGGSGSGKSAYAESLFEQEEKRKYYLATMQVYDEEGKQKVERHRRLRAGKGFLTVEQPRSIDRALEQIADAAESSVLLECMSNLVANEMFAAEDTKPQEEADSAGGPFGREEPRNRAEQDTAERIIRQLEILAGALKNLVIVTNNVFEDGMTYEASTMEYLRTLAEVNRRLAARADAVIEVVVGIPVVIR